MYLNLCPILINLRLLEKMRLIVTFSILASFLLSCKPDQEEGIPAYIKIDTLKSDLDYATQGSNSHNFTEAWVLVDGQLQGIYSVPALFPVLETGTRDILIRPGIKRNGAAAGRLDHPHFQNLVYNAQSLRIGDTLVLEPSFELNTGITVWFEDFEEAGFKFTNTDNTDTNLVRIENDPNVFEGIGSGYAYLLNDQQSFSFFTTENFKFRFGTPVYLEFDYKMAGFFKISLLVHNSNGGDNLRTVLFVAPKLDDSGNPIYNKIYISLSEIIATEVNATSFDIVFQGFTDIGQTNVPFFIDNVKVLYPQ